MLDYVYLDINDRRQLVKMNNIAKNLSNRSIITTQLLISIVNIILLLNTIIVVLSPIPVVFAFPTGAPESACKELKPGHGAEPTSGTPPFELSQDKLQVEANDQIKGNYQL